MKNNKGYTIIEAVIAMLLVSVVVAGIFSALMASRRAIIEPSYKEDMIFAVESANNQLKNYIVPSKSNIPSALKDGLCGNDLGGTALDVGTHDIKCKLPDVCNTTTSSFTYTVSDVKIAVPGVSGQEPAMKNIKFSIVCNREVL